MKKSRKGRENVISHRGREAETEMQTEDKARLTVEGSCTFFVLVGNHFSLPAAVSETESPLLQNDVHSVSPFRYSPATKTKPQIRHGKRKRYKAEHFSVCKKTNNKMLSTYAQS